MTNYKLVNTLNLSDSSYIAGLIDGDGSITLTRKHRNENRQLAISISNNEKQMLKFVLQTVGAGIITKKRVYADNHKMNLTYRVTNRQALDLLKQIAPYLRSYKRERAELILDKYLNLTPRNGKYTPKLLAKREAFIAEFHEIKS